MIFKVGDIIAGTKSADKMYSYTTSKAIMKVIRVNKFDIDIKILSHKRYPDCVGNIYPVNPKHFTLVSLVKSNYIEIEEK